MLTIPTVPPRIALGGTVSSIAHPFIDRFIRMRARWIRVFNAHLTSPHACKSVQPFLRCIYPLLLGGQVYVSWEPLDGFFRCFHSLIATNFCILGVPFVWRRAHSLWCGGPISGQPPPTSTAHISATHGAFFVPLVRLESPHSGLSNEPLNVPNGQLDIPGG